MELDKLLLNDEAAISIQQGCIILRIFFLNIRKPKINHIEILQVWKYTGIKQ